MARPHSKLLIILKFDLKFLTSHFIHNADRHYIAQDSYIDKSH